MVQVSVVMPCHNGEKFLKEAIQSVISQTFIDWELLVINDNSTDNSVIIIEEFCKIDTRIKLLHTRKSTGSPATPRNVGIENAQGRFIAFLDCDDIWLPKKLELQLPFFKNEEIAIVFSDYEKISKDGKRDNRIIEAPPKISYSKLLKSNCIGNLTGCYDTKKVGKVFNQLHGHEDYILWLSILKKGFYAQNCGEITALYRLSDSSVSHNKFWAVKWQWDIYRNVLNLPLAKSVFFYFCYLILAFRKFIK